MKYIKAIFTIVLSVLFIVGIVHATTIATLTSNESGANSLNDINNNFAALNAGKMENISYNPLSMASLVASSSATSTFSGGIYSSFVAAPRLSATSSLPSTFTGSVSIGSYLTSTSTSYLEIGGVKTYIVRQSLTSGTTTPCAIQAPNATTTANRLTITFNTSTTTSTLWGISTSTTPFATSSVAFISSAALSANRTDEIVWQPANTWNVIAPNQWIVCWSYGTNAGGGTIITGQVTGTFQTLY